MVGKAEHTLDGSNPRFVVTSLKCTRVAYDARALYEDLYCARGEAENRIGEQFEMFRRSRIIGNDVSQSVADVVLGNGLRAGRHFASCRPAPFPVR